MASLGSAPSATRADEAEVQSRNVITHLFEAVESRERNRVIGPACE